MIDPNKPNATIELETADLLQLGQSGLVEGKANKTRELQLADLEELREGTPIQDPKVMVDLGPDPDAPPREQNVFIDFGPEAAATPTTGARSSAQPAETLEASAHETASPAKAAAALAPASSVVVEGALSRPHKPTPFPAAALVTPPVSFATPVNVQRVTPTMPKVEVATPRNTAQLYLPRRGMGIVVLVYLVAAAALAASIYFRWFA